MGIVVIICMETVTTTNINITTRPTFIISLSALLVGDYHYLPLYTIGIGQENTISLLPQNTFVDVDVLFPFLLTRTRAHKGQKIQVSINR